MSSPRSRTAGPRPTSGRNHARFAARLEDRRQERQYRDGDGDGQDRHPDDLTLASDDARGGGREHHALRGEQARVAPGDVLHRRRELLGDAEAPRRLYLQRHKEGVRGGVRSGERPAQGRQDR